MGNGAQRPQTSILEVRDHPLCRVGRDPCVDVPRRRERDLAISEMRLHRDGSDHDDVVTYAGQQLGCTSRLSPYAAFHFHLSGPNETYRGNGFPSGWTEARRREIFVKLDRVALGQICLYPFGTRFGSGAQSIRTAAHAMSRSSSL
jgi:hypothetical protein